MLCSRSVTALRSTFHLPVRTSHKISPDAPRHCPDTDHEHVNAQEGKTAVLVGTVTDDVRLYDVPKLRVVALRVTETARARILKVLPGAACVCWPVKICCVWLWLCRTLRCSKRVFVWLPPWLFSEWYIVLQTKEGGRRSAGSRTVAARTTRSPGLSLGSSR